MKVYRIEQFKCHFCSQWFNATTRLPLRLRCSHNICRFCAESTRRSSQPLKIICPEDLEVSLYRSIEDIEVDVVTKHVLERLLSQNNMKKCNSQLDMIKEYSKMFDELTCQGNSQVQKLNELIDEIYKDQINRIQCIWTRVKMEVNRPLKIMQDWKNIVKGYLKTLKKVSESGGNGVCDLTQFQHYLQEGKKIHLQVTNFLNTNRQKTIESIIKDRTLCFINDFSLINNNLKRKDPHNDKQNKLKVSAFDQSSKKIDNIEQIRKRASQNMDSSMSRKALAQISNNIDNRSSCSIFQLSKSVSLAGEPQNSPANVLPERLHQMKKLTDRKSGRYQQRVESSPSSNKPNTNLTSKTVARGGSKSSRASSHQEVLKQIEQLNEEMLISTYDQRPLNAQQSVEEEIEKCSTQQSHIHHRFQYHEPTVELRDKITKALRKPINLVNYFHPQQKKQIIESPTHQTRRGYIYDCEAQKQSYALKMKIMKVQEALLNTTVGSNFIELMNHPLESVDFRCYLEVLPWDPRVEILKFVKTNLRDQQFNILLNYVANNPSVHTLVVSSNQLTEDSLDMLLMFLQSNNLKSVYLSKNYVNLLRAKPKIAQLKAQSINIYV